MIICIAGPSCAGKTTCAEYIQEQAGIPCIEASDSVKRRRDANAPEEPIIEFADRKLSEEGKDTFARDVKKKIDDFESKHIIVSGFRTLEEVEYIRDQYHQVRLYGIYANSLLRFQRKKHRDDIGSDYSYREFVEKDFTEYEFGITALLENSLDAIINEGTFDELFHKTDDRIIGGLK
jgi:dephospho-CoA kinase